MSLAEELCIQAKERQAQRDLEQAKRLLGSAIELDPDLITAHERLAGLCFLTGQYEQAIEHYQRVVRLDPRHSPALVNLGAVHNKLKNFSEAVKVLRSAIARNSRCPEAYYNLGIAHRGLNQHAMAVSAYKEAVRLNPQMHEAYYNLANALMDLNNHSQAKLNFRKAIELRPNFAKALDGLKRAEQIAQGAKQNVNPFGRLVNMQDVEQKHQPSELVLSLTPLQRSRDRQLVHNLAHQGLTSGQSFLEQLKGQLEPNLLEMTRMVSEGCLTQAHEQKFHRAVGHFRIQLSKLKQSMDLLRQHELQLDRERTAVSDAHPTSQSATSQDAPHQPQT